jgi:Mrp family chromosome partitioning ATPase
MDLRRYLDALRRDSLLIAFIVILVTGSAIGVSLLLPKTYQATAKIVLEDTSNPLVGNDQAQRRLTTARELVDTQDVLAAAASRVGQETASSLDGKVDSSVDTGADIIRVSVTDRHPRRAAEIANAVTNVFLAKQRERELKRLNSARARLVAQLNVLRRSAPSGPEVQAIREQLSALAASEATAGSDLQVAETATAPDSPSSPKPVRNGVLALFASLFLGVVVALVRDSSRVKGPRELSRLTDLPLLARIPYARRVRRPGVFTGLEHAAYETLQRAISFELPPDQQHIVLVTSALAGEGKTRVVAGLGRALAQDGRNVLLISADLRWPKLHEFFGLKMGPGVSDILTSSLQSQRPPFRSDIVELMTEPLLRPQGNGYLRLLPSGNTVPNPARLFSSELLERFFAEIRRFEFDHVLVDAAPLLGVADTHALSRWCTEMLIVARLDRLRLENVADLRDTLDRLHANAVGLVVIGREGSVSSRYPQAYSEGEDLQPEGLRELGRP